MTASPSCPPSDKLRRLLSGTPADNQAELIGHLDRCAGCRGRLERLAGADPALLNAARTLHGNAYLNEPPLRRLLHDLGSDASLISLYRPHGRVTVLPAVAPDILGPLDNYEVTEVLGQGGMGLVLKAFDLALKRWVAIKALAPNLAGDRLARLRFAREAQAAAAVRHEHIITIYSVSEARGLPYFVMEYVAGGSLQDYLDRHGPPDWRSAAELAAAVATGLAAAHAQGLIHRDIKPSNILLAADGGPGDAPRTTHHAPRIPKIADFGLAYLADAARLTQTSIVAGTPLYMAPEQALGEPLDHRADLFSFGSVLYILCTGRKPFSATTPLAVLRQVCELTPPPIHTINATIPLWLSAVVERLQARRPGDRFGSAAEVAELLRYNLDHPEQLRTVARIRPTPQRRRKTWRLVVPAILMLLLMGGVLLSGAGHWMHGLGSGTPAEEQQNPLPLRATLRGHKGPVWSVAFSPDGKLLATGSDDTSVRFWDVASGEERALLPGHNSAVFAVAFAHSGKFLISGDGDGSLRLWDVFTREELPALPPHNGNIRRLALSPDDRLVAVGSTTHSVEVWDLQAHQLQHTLPGHHGTILALAFAVDGQAVATGDAGGHIRFWQPTTGNEEANFAGDALSVRALAFAPDGRTLASTGAGGKEVKLWRVADHEQLAALTGHEHDVLSLTFAPDGRYLAGGCRDGTVLVWEVASGRMLVQMHAHQGAVWAVGFSPDGHNLATAGEDRLGKVWSCDGLADVGP